MALAAHCNVHTLWGRLASWGYSPCAWGAQTVPRHLQDWSYVALAGPQCRVRLL